MYHRRKSWGNSALSCHTETDRVQWCVIEVDRVTQQTMASPAKTFQDVVELMARLRAPGGCPWDRAQDARSLRTYLLEEAYEVLDAIEEESEGADEALCEELGDLLLQVVFHAEIAQETGRFTIDDVLTRLHEKLVRRHPHVFGSGEAATPDEVRATWEQLKHAEKAEKSDGGAPPGVLEGVSRRLPALLEAFQLTRKASQVGFDWEKAEDVLEKLREEMDEVRAELKREDDSGVEAEVGDLLFAAVNVSRFLGVDPEVALRKTNRKFVRRFEKIERELAEQGSSPANATLAEMDALWEQAKADE